ncbi:DUF6230 family protein [Actinomadura rifamycini]|uniref:DUF6230 family protein n=1 Tax=Actinomadura rifamycini TaxID=31962 RepID=UPI0007E8BB5A|nr:DUF6230 family protein [Actinomadura rifamycini]
MTRPLAPLRRFLVLFVPAVGALAVLAFGMAQGALPASFAVSGRQMQVSADELSGQGFGLHPAVVRTADGADHPVMVLTMRSARVRGLCQSAHVDTPLGRYTVRLGATDPARASQITGLSISATHVDADVDFTSLLLNRDAGGLGTGTPADGSPGDFGVGAGGFTVTDVKADAWMVAGGSFQVTGLDVSFGRDVPACF